MPLRRPWVLVVFTNACGVNFWIFLILDKKFTFLLNFVTYLFYLFFILNSLLSRRWQKRVQNGEDGEQHEQLGWPAFWGMSGQGQQLH